jgi:hypothetical protein
MMGLVVSLVRLASLVAAGVPSSCPVQPVMKAPATNTANDLIQFGFTGRKIAHFRTASNGSFRGVRFK